MHQGLCNVHLNPDFLGWPSLKVDGATDGQNSDQPLRWLDGKGGVCSPVSLFIEGLLVRSGSLLFVKINY